MFYLGGRRRVCPELLDRSIIAYLKKIDSGFKTDKRVETRVSCSILVDGGGRLVLNDWMGASKRILLELDGVLLGDFVFSFVAMALLVFGPLVPTCVQPPQTRDAPGSPWYLVPGTLLLWHPGVR